VLRIPDPAFRFSVSLFASIGPAVTGLVVLPPSLLRCLCDLLLKIRVEPAKRASPPFRCSSFNEAIDPTMPMNGS